MNTPLSTKDVSLPDTAELLKLLRFQRLDARNGSIAGEPDAIRICGAAADAIEQLTLLLAEVNHIERGHKEEIDQLRAALTLMYDKWSDGDPCYDDPDNRSGYLGNAFKLDKGQEKEILELIGDRS